MIKTMFSTREPSGSACSPSICIPSEIMIAVLTGRWETVTDVWQLGCFLAVLTIHSRTLEKTYFPESRILQPWMVSSHFEFMTWTQGFYCHVFWLGGNGSFSFPVPPPGCDLTASCFLLQVPGESEKQWKPALVVLTEKDLLIYDSMPRRKEAWFSPVHTYPLLATR